MPLMISLRKFRLASTTGHVIQFKPKEPVYVPDDAVPEAMAQGCVPANEEDVPFYEDMSRARVEFQGDIRRSLIITAIERVMDRNDHRDFTGGGVPRHKVLGDLLGFEVFESEVSPLYQQYLSAKKEGVDIPLHPATDNVKRVLDASGKADLVDLAVEFGVEKKKAEGLVTKDLRRMLLVKFSGIAPGDGD